MKKLLLLSCLLAIAVTVGAAEFFKPDQYSWWFCRVDIKTIPGQIPKCQESPLIGGRVSPAMYQFKIDADEHVDIQLRSGINGPTIAEFQLKGKPGELTLPDLPRGHYWLICKIIRADGTLKRVDMMTCNIIDSSITTLPVKQTQATPFRVKSVTDGMVKIEGVSANPEIKIEMVSRNMFGEKMEEKTQTTVAPITEIELGKLQPGQARWLTASLTRNGKLVDQDLYLDTVAGSYPAHPLPLQGLPGPETKDPNALRSSENQPVLYKLKNFLPALEKQIAESRNRNTDVLNIGLNRLAIEPVTGVYDWSYLDEYVEYLSKNKVRFGFVYLGAGTPIDAWGEWMIDQNGEAFLCNPHLYVSTSAKSYRIAVAAMVKALVERYHNQPWFSGYVFINQGWDSSIYYDHFNRSCDYSWWARQDFIDWLKNNYTSIEKVNQAWKTKFTAWESITPPMPEYDKEVNVSPAWVDFIKYRLKQYEGVSTGLYDPIVRSIDQTHPIKHYMILTGPFEYLFPGMVKNRSGLSDGAGEGSQMGHLFGLAANWKVKGQAESHYVPAYRKRDLQDKLLNALRFGGNSMDLALVWNTEFSNIMERYPKNKELAEAMQWWSQAVPVMRELQNTEKMQMPIGVITSWADMLYRTRAWRWYATTGSNMQSLAEHNSLPNPTWLTEWTPDTVFAQQKLIVVPSDCRVWDPQLTAKLKDFVSMGGKLLISGNAGQYTPGCEDQFLWTSALSAPVLSVDKAKEDKKAEADLAGNHAMMKIGINTTFKPDAKLVTASDKTVTACEWKLGQGKILWFQGNIEEALGDKFIPAMLAWAEIKPLVTSSNPEVQGMLLQDDKRRFLILSSFQGIDKLRLLKQPLTHNAEIRLPQLEDGQWKLRWLLPAGRVDNISAETLRTTGFKVQLTSSDLFIIALEK